MTGPLEEVSPIYVPAEKVVLHQHVLDALFQGLLLLLSLGRKFPVLGEAEGKAAEDTELTLDLNPAGAAQEGPGLVPLLHGRQAGAQHLQPQV